MPFIEVKAFDTRWESPEKTAELIERITKAMADTFGEQVGRETEVVLIGVPRPQWGFGGKARI
ncbi:tautomerase family protein [Conexibacter arvalis]|uniref:Phenylpyruvate tautomerase PptA (4-oxalocrotonate tautomerase family) n=1 Tax=Conexibacter arvalis TaxID=912552 RepID=A0A840ICV7_9ACTN|nr:phenylpyruvate tautomerase PptA (4-oxalocrotonate tautomerase family) [Conexibacter arvalis]